jgi:hypothetical protein
MQDPLLDDAANQAIAEAGDVVTDNSAVADPANSPTVDANQQVPPAFDPSAYAFEVNGKKVLPKDQNEVRMWLSGGYKFSQNQAEFKKKSAELEARSKKVAELERLNEAFEKNPDFQKKVMEWYTQSLTPQQQDMVDNGQANQLPPDVLAKLEKFEQVSQKVDTFEQEMNRLKEEKEDQILSNELSGLKDKYKQFDWTADMGEGNLEYKVLKIAHDKGLSNLEDALRIATYDNIIVNS